MHCPHRNSKEVDAICLIYNRIVILLIDFIRRANTLFKEWLIDGEYYKRFYA